MKVYLLYVSDWESSEWVSGVYSTYEKAVEASKLVSTSFRSSIVEEEVQ